MLDNIQYLYNWLYGRTEKKENKTFNRMGNTLGAQHIDVYGLTHLRNNIN